MIYFFKIEDYIKPLSFHPVVYTWETLARIQSTICGHRIDGSELAHEGIRFVTLALLPPAQVGCGPRGLAKLEHGDCKLEKEKTSLQMTTYRSLWLLGQSDPRSLGTSFLPKIASCLKWSSPLPWVGISWAKCLSSSMSWRLKAGESGIKHIWVCIPARPLGCYPLLGKLLNLSEPYFLMF